MIAPTPYPAVTRATAAAGPPRVRARSRIRHPRKRLATMTTSVTVLARTLEQRANAAPGAPYDGTATIDITTARIATLDVKASTQPGRPSPRATSLGGPAMARNNAATASSRRHGVAARLNSGLTHAPRSVGANTTRNPTTGPMKRIVNLTCDWNANFSRDESDP